MVRFFIDRPIFAWVIAIAVSLLGLLAILILPVDRYPLLIDSAAAMFDCDPATYYADGIELFLAGVTALAARREHRPA